MTTYSPAKSLLVTEMKNNPGESEKGIADLMVAHFEANWELRYEVYANWLKNHQAALKVSTDDRTGSTSVGKRKKATARKRAVKRAVKAIVDTILLDLILPGGKKLRDSTFSECGKYGGWLADLSKRGNPNARVGNHMSEQDLRNLRFRNMSPSQIRAAA